MAASSTWSPLCTEPTRDPTSSTMPAPSWPITHGNGNGKFPFWTATSEWHSPEATIRTRTSSSPIAVSSTSETVTSEPGS